MVWLLAGRAGRCLCEGRSRTDTSSPLLLSLAVLVPIVAFAAIALRHLGRDRREKARYPDRRRQARPDLCWFRLKAPPSHTLQVALLRTTPWQYENSASTKVRRTFPVGVEPVPRCEACRAAHSGADSAVRSAEDDGPMHRRTLLAGATGSLGAAVVATLVLEKVAREGGGVNRVPALLFLWFVFFIVFVIAWRVWTDQRRQARHAGVLSAARTLPLSAVDEWPAVATFLEGRPTFGPFSTGEERGARILGEP